MNPIVRPQSVRRVRSSASPSDSVIDELRRYDDHLRDVRGLAAGTRRIHCRIVAQLLAKEVCQWRRHYGQATCSRRSPLHRLAVVGQPLAFCRCPSGNGLAKLPPLPDRLRRLGCRAERSHFHSGAVEARFAPARAQAEPSSTAAGCLPLWAVAPTRFVPSFAAHWTWDCVLARSRNCRLATSTGEREPSR